MVNYYVYPQFRRPHFLSKLPTYYYKHWCQLQKPPKSEVHDPQQGLHLDYVWQNRERGAVTRHDDVPIPMLYPKEADQGLWGGEGIVKGYKKLMLHRQRHVPLIPRYWYPRLTQRVCYSEILDKYIRIVMTESVMRKIDDHYGFDDYILRTPIEDLRSQLALNLRRQMYMALRDQNFHPDNPEKKKYVIEKYKDCLIPNDEIEWFGLETSQAVTKMKIIEAHKYNRPPLKAKFTKLLIEKLEDIEAKGELDQIRPPEEPKKKRLINLFKRDQ